MTKTIFIFCDDESHPRRRVAVTNFDLTPAGWNERPSSKAPTGDEGAGLIGTGRQMVRDLPAQVGWALDPANGSDETRVRFELSCRKCRSSVPLRADTLWAVLDGWSAAGFTDLPLRQIAATVGRQQRE